MSAWMKRNVSPSRRWPMFCSDPVSKLSTQITRCPRSINASHRCDPRKPAPPVTKEVGMRASLEPVSGDDGQAARLDRQRGRREVADVVAVDLDRQRPVVQRLDQRAVEPGEA